MRYENGEYMSLIWEGGRPDAYYVRGHVSRSEGIDTLINEGAIDEESEVGEAVRKYGRWSMEGDMPEGCNCVLREYKESGRGRFKITAFGVGIFAKPKSTGESK